MTVKLYHGDCLQVLGRLEAESVHCVVTSPPYWGLRDYGTATWEGGGPGCDHDQRRREHDPDSKSATNSGAARDGLAGKTLCRKCGARRVDAQLGLEATVEEHVEKMVEVFRAVRRVMRKDAVLFLNYGDTYRGKQLLGLPWRVAFALQADGWWLRSDIIWSKPNPMPESVTDRPTKSHEHLFLLAKSSTYFYDADAVRVPHAEKTLTHRGQGSCGKASSQDSLGKVASGSWSKTVRIVDPRGCNLRDVWVIPTEPFPGAHFATFSTKLVEPCIKAGCPEGGTVLDPFAGACTTLLVADRLGRNGIGIELNPEYARMGADRIRQDCPMFSSVDVVEPTASSQTPGDGSSGAEDAIPETGLTANR